MSSSAFTPSTTTVTNNVPVNVPVVEAGQDYTGAITGGGSATYNYVSRKWRRVGDSVQVNWYFSVTATGSGASNLLLPLPTGMTVDFTKTLNGQIIGSGYRLSGGSKNAAFTPRVITGTSNAFVIETSSGSILTGSAVVSGEEFNLTATIAIAEWAGSGTTTLATRAVEEYAWNSDPGVAAGTNYTNSVYYGNGPSGTPFVSVNSTTTTGYNRTGYYVKFQTPILPTDNLFLEISTDGGLIWSNGAPNETQVFFIGGSSVYGMSIVDKVDSTTLRIGFGNAGRRPDATYGGVGAAWSTVSGSTYRWRVRKVSSGSQIGYPVSARNIVGDTSGTVVPTGMIGEVLTATLSNVTIASSSTATTVGSLVLTAGTWQVYGKSCWSASSGASTATYYRVSISTTAATEHMPTSNAVFNSSGVPDFYVSPCSRLISTTGQTVHMVGLAVFTGTAQPTVSINSTFYAVRIA